MLKLLTKIAADILPSVVATVIGAYIVNHYINARPAADIPAAAASAADPQKADPGAQKAEANRRPDPEAGGVTGRGIPEKGMTEKTAAEGSDARPAEPAGATAPVAPHHPLTPHERRVAKASQTVEAATEDHRSAIELAKAAIERLRGTSDKEPPRTIEKEPPRPAAASVVRPLPPPITVTMPGSDTSYPHPGAARADDPNRPTPPADIPQPPDLRVDATATSSARDNASNLADDMLSAARSMFHVVLPGQSKLSD